MKEVLRFIADDGLEFDSWSECHSYEQYRMPIVPETNKTKYIWEYEKSKILRGTQTTLVSKCDNKGCCFNDSGKCTASGNECFGYFVEGYYDE